MHLVEDDNKNDSSPAASAHLSSGSAQSMVPPAAAAMLGSGAVDALGNIGCALTSSWQASSGATPTVLLVLFPAPLTVSR